jgi:hypothetical protein
MARFFLHIRTSDGVLIRDDEGTELLHLGRLRDTATKVAADLIRDDPAAADWTLEVSDETDRVVLSEKLRQFVPVGSPPGS